MMVRHCGSSPLRNGRRISMRASWLGNSLKLSVSRLRCITVDWATLFDLRSQEDKWDAFVTGHGFVPDPSQLTLIGQMGVYPGWWDSDESQALAEDLLRQSDFEPGYAIWEELQSQIYTEIPAIKLGDVAQASYYSEAVHGWVGQADRGIPYWNLWLTT